MYLKSEIYLDDVRVKSCKRVSYWKYYLTSFSMEVLWSLPVAWENQKWPKKGELTLEMEEKRDDLSQLPFSESASCQAIASLREKIGEGQINQAKLPAMEKPIPKQKLLILRRRLGRCHWLWLSRLPVIFARNTDMVRYIVQQLKLKLEVASRYYVFYDVSL